MALLRGNIIESLLYHPIVLYTVVILGWFFAAGCVEKLTGRRIRLHFPISAVWLWVALAIVFVNCTVKNLILYATGIALLE